MPYCRGYTIREEGSTHDLVYGVPDGYDVFALRRYLTLPDSERHSIDARIEFALKLATSVHAFHCAGMVHKCITPDSILVYVPDLDPSQEAEVEHHILGTPVLAGFHHARSEYTETEQFSFPEDMRTGIYIHPRHNVAKERPPYDMEDDIYSLGVCLFEIGAWRSMFEWRFRSSTGKEGYTTSTTPDDRQWPFNFNVHPDVEDGDGSPWYIRSQRMKKAAADILPTVMGNAYADVVLACLRFQDDRSRRRLDMDRDKISLEFVKRVLVELYRLQSP